MQVEAARGRALADEYHIKYFETSAKDGSNVSEAFHTIARDVLTDGDGLAPAPIGAVRREKEKKKECIIC